MVETREDAVREWIEALRSGQYDQGSERLISEEGFCCLGVFCDLRARKGEGSWRKDADGEYYFKTPDSGEVEASLPSLFVKFLRVVGEYVEIKIDVVEKAVGKVRCKELTQDILVGCPDLANLNDRGATFEELADIIELHLLGDDT